MILLRKKIVKLILGHATNLTTQKFAVLLKFGLSSSRLSLKWGKIWPEVVEIFQCGGLG